MVWACVVIVKLADVAPDGTVTVAGKIALLELEARLTVAPPAGAGALRITEPCNEPPAATCAARSVTLCNSIATAPFCTGTYKLCDPAAPPRVKVSCVASLLGT